MSDDVVDPYPDGAGPVGPWRDTRPFLQRHPAIAGVAATVILGSLAWGASLVASLSLRDTVTRCQVQLVDEKTRCVVCADAHGVTAVSCDWGKP